MIQTKTIAEAEGKQNTPSEITNDTQLGLTGIISEEPSLEEIMGEVSLHITKDFNPDNHAQSRREEHPLYILDAAKYENFAKISSKATKPLIGTDVFEKYFTNEAYHHNAKVGELALALGMSLSMKEDDLVNVYKTAVFKDAGLINNNYTSQELASAKLKYYTDGTTEEPMGDHMVQSIYIMMNNGFNRDLYIAVASQYQFGKSPLHGTKLSNKYAEVIKMADEFVTKEEETELNTSQILKSMIGKYDRNSMEKMINVFAKTGASVEQSSVYTEVNQSNEQYIKRAA